MQSLRLRRRRCFLCARRLSSTTPPPPPPAEGVPFAIGLKEAERRFRSFCEEKGVKLGLVLSNVLELQSPTFFTSVTPVFVPFWAFETTARVRTKKGATVRLSRTGFGKNMVYGGYNYHRGLLRGLTCPSLLVSARPFRSSMLTDNRALGLPRIEADAWSVYMSTAWRAARQTASAREREIAKRESNVPSASSGGGGGGTDDLEVHFVLHGVRRIYVPVFVFEYRFFGQPFHVFVSGAARTDTAHAASGVEHGSLTADLSSGLEEVQRVAADAMQRVVTFGLPSTVLGRLLFEGGRIFAGAVLRGSVFVVQRFPLLWPVAIGGFVVFRVIYAPLRARRLSLEEWMQQAKEEREQQADAGESWTWADEFDPAAYETRRRQQQKAHSAGAQQFAHDFEKTSPEELLGVRRGASQEELKAAFRREMLLWHPDFHRGETNDEQEYALARSQAITAAYGKLRKTP